MKMVAAARLRRAEDRVKAARPYIERLQHFLDNITFDPGKVPHPLAEKRYVRHTGVLLMTSDRGLCGAFNANLFKEADKFIKGIGSDKVTLYVMGRKGFDHYKRTSLNIEDKFLNMDQAIAHREVKEINNKIADDFLDEKIDELYLIFSAYKSPAVCKPTVMKILPIVAQEDQGEHGEGRHTLADVILQPSSEAILETLFPKLLFSRILVSIAETFASEQGQRMVAMTTATDNAAEMVSSLTLQFNKVRQAAITKEISEIVGGAEAIK